MRIFESGEDYLETILLLTNKLGNVRAIDIVKETGYSKPSISLAMKKLKEKGLIDIVKSSITLTDEGRKIASDIYKKHQLLTKFLMSLGVDEETAKADACKIEHHLSEESYLAIKRSLE